MSPIACARARGRIAIVLSLSLALVMLGCLDRGRQKDLSGESNVRQDGNEGSDPVNLGPGSVPEPSSRENNKSNGIDDDRKIEAFRGPATDLVRMGDSYFFDVRSIDRSCMIEYTEGQGGQNAILMPGGGFVIPGEEEDNPEDWSRTERGLVVIPSKDRWSVLPVGDILQIGIRHVVSWGEEDPPTAEDLHWGQPGAKALCGTPHKRYGGRYPPQIRNLEFTDAVPPDCRRGVWVTHDRLKQLLGGEEAPQGKNGAVVFTFIHNKYGRPSRAYCAVMIDGSKVWTITWPVSKDRQGER